MRRLALISLAFAPFLGTGEVEAETTADRCDNCGRIQSIRTVTDQATSWRPLGTVAPTTITGDPSEVGRTTTTFQIGRGGTNQGMVMLGAAGGATYARRPESYQKPRWEVVVNMDSGPPRTLSLDYDPLVQEGDRVQVYGTQLQLAQP